MKYCELQLPLVGFPRKSVFFFIKQCKHLSGIKKIHCVELIEMNFLKKLTRLELYAKSSDRYN